MVRASNIEYVVKTLEPRFLNVQILGELCSENKPSPVNSDIEHYFANSKMHFVGVPFI